MRPNDADEIANSNRRISETDGCSQKVCNNISIFHGCMVWIEKFFHEGH